MTTSDLAGLLKGSSVLTLQNNFGLNNLTTIRALNAGALRARAWDSLRAAVQGVPFTRPMGPIRDDGGNAAAQDLSAWAGQDLPRMRRGDERC
jgi:hypothetical protein